MEGTLYIVATPIGNLKDISERAVETLKRVEIILSEDTRVSKKLLDYIKREYGGLGDFKLISYHQHSGEAKKLEILNYLLKGKAIALLTDAGTPGISDPGNELIDYLLSYKKDLSIVPIPGASSITTALSICGFNVNKFMFLGFFPKKKRTKLMSWIKEERINFCFFESPKRIVKTLSFLKETFGGGIRIFVGRELTKMYEQTYRGPINSVLKEIREGKSVKGEIVAVVELK